MSVPSTQTQWVVKGQDKGFDGLVKEEGAVPKVGEYDVLVRLYGASLNYRDLIIPKVSIPTVKTESSSAL